MKTFLRNLKSLKISYLRYSELLNRSLLKVLRRKKWKRPTMATCHTGKNLREENRDGKPAQAAKARLRQFRLLLPALAFVNLNENGKFRVRHVT
jgi:hypothetical protein